MCDVYLNFFFACFVIQPPFMPVCPNIGYFNSYKITDNLSSGSFCFGVIPGSSQSVLLAVFKGTIYGAKDGVGAGHVQGKCLNKPCTISLACGNFVKVVQRFCLCFVGLCVCSCVWFCVCVCWGDGRWWLFTVVEIKLGIIYTSYMLLLLSPTYRICVLCLKETHT